MWHCTEFLIRADHPTAPGHFPGNPIIPGALMLDHVGLQESATRLRSALRTALVTDGVRTRDLGGTATTAEITGAILRRL